MRNQTHLATIADQFSHAIAPMARGPPKSPSAPVDYAPSNPQTLLWHWHWRHHRLVLYGTRWCPTYWHFPPREWMSHSRPDQMFSVWYWIDLKRGDVRENVNWDKTFYKQRLIKVIVITSSDCLANDKASYLSPVASSRSQGFIQGHERVPSIGFIKG